ncbi:GTPase family protein [Shewanella baltica]|uniref:GTPase family protein n=1 Tax=Shewanella baltica TaxID=62322 RepID=UPI000DFF1D2A|nr:GTPase [Shewanella baltica]SUI57591.1 GTPase Era [Shewanella baltica]
MDNMFSILQETDEHFTAEQAQRIHDKLSHMLNYRPRVGIFGKTGAGKSSLCNALFGREICQVSDIEACTRAPQEVMLNLDNAKGIILIDVPGVGEDQQRDDEYAALYQSLLPELDLVIWVLKADDRAYSVDMDFYHNLVKPHLDQGKPFILALNQVDKIEPSRHWDCLNKVPSSAQAENIDLKIAGVAQSFSLKRSAVIPVSADEGYGLSKLVDEIIFSLPDEKKLSVAKEVPAKNLSKQAKQEVEISVLRVLTRTLAGAASGAALGAKYGGKPGAVIGSIVGGIGGFFGIW